MKNNIWNRLFHRKVLKEYLASVEMWRQICGWYPQIMQDIRESETLEDLLKVHKGAWDLGFQNENLAPCPWGMFRTKSIPEMKPEEVFLGGIWGLCTKPIPFWNEYKDEDMSGNGFGIREETKIYDLIFNQYRSLLVSNIRDIKFDAEEKLSNEK